jgi:hypothetical protein
MVASDRLRHRCEYRTATCARGLSSYPCAPAPSLYPARGRDAPRALIAGDILAGATITPDVEDDELVVRWQNPGVEEEASAEPVPVNA